MRCLPVSSLSRLTNLSFISWQCQYLISHSKFVHLNKCTWLSVDLCENASANDLFGSVKIVELFAMLVHEVLSIGPHDSVLLATYLCVLISGLGLCYKAPRRLIQHFLMTIFHGVSCGVTCTFNLA